MNMTMLARFLENPTAERLARIHLHFLWQGLFVGDPRLAAACGACGGLRPARDTSVTGDPAGSAGGSAPS